MALNKNGRHRNPSHVSNVVVSKHSFESTYYPINFEPADNYVFFSTLYDKDPRSIGRNLASRAERFLYGPTRNPMTTFRGDANQKIISALNFLKAAAEFQYNEELKFIDYYRSQMSDELKKELDKIMDNSSNQYFSLINQLNTILKGSYKYKQELNIEIKRIRDRKHLLDFDKSKENTNLTSKDWEEREEILGEKSFFTGNSMVTEPYYKTDINKIFHSLFSDRFNFSIITGKIIEQYGPKVFELKKGQLQLDNRQVAVLIEKLAEKTYDILMVQYRNELGKNTGETQKQRRQRIEALVTKVITEDKEIDNFFNSFVNSADAGATLDSLANQYGIPYTSELKKLKQTNAHINSMTKHLKQGWANNNNNNGNKKAFDKWRQQNDATVEDLKEIYFLTSGLTIQAYYKNEGMAVSTMIENGVFAALSEGKQVTEDFQAGKLILYYQYKDDPKKMKIIKNAEHKLAVAQKQLSQELQTTTNKKTFNANIEAYRKFHDREEEILTQLARNLDEDTDIIKDMISHINIHGSVKGYASIGATRKAFEGASFGSNIVQQVDIINQMLVDGGITDLDANWLLFALINCGTGMIGAQNKNSLEDYLSAFAGFLMFNDASDVIKNTVDFMTDKYSDTSVKDIHIYVLNNFYIPSSYILNETYKRLGKLYTNLDIENKMAGSDIRIQFKQTYNPKKTSGFSQDELRFPDAIAWKRERAEALKQTKLIMSFMSGFLSFLNKLQQQMNFK